MMTPDGYQPRQLASRLARRRDCIQRQKDAAGVQKEWRQTYILPRQQARTKAREWIDHVSNHSAYITEFESWRDLGDGRIECIVRRVPAG